MTLMTDSKICKFIATPISKWILTSLGKFMVRTSLFFDLVWMVHLPQTKKKKLKLNFYEKNVISAKSRN